MRLPRIFRTASFRLAALYVLFFTISVLILGAVAFWTTRNAIEQQIRARIEADATSLLGEFRSDGLSGMLAAVRERERHVGQLYYLVQSPGGKRLAGQLLPVSPVAPGEGWVTLDVPSGGNGRGGPDKALAFLTRLPDGVLLVVADDFDRLSDAEEATLTALAWIVAVTALLGIGGGLLLSRGFLRRVDTISRTAEAIIAGDLERRIPLRGSGDDLDHLAVTLNRMLDRIGALMASVRQVSTDIAHDLRTPLSRLLQRLDVGRSEARTPDDYAHAIDLAMADVQEILETFGALLQIAQLEAGSNGPKLKDVDLSLVADTVVEAFGPSAEEQGRTLIGRVTPEVHVRGNRELLTQLLVNLVENALHHTPQGTSVVISVPHSVAGMVQLSVEDNGPGISAEERDLVLRRFYRCERSRTTPGNGLGLSLVAAIAALHGAEIRLEDAAPGLRVIVIFPSAMVPGSSAKEFRYGTGSRNLG